MMAEQTPLEKRLASTGGNLRSVFEIESSSSSRFVVLIDKSYNKSYIEEYSPDGKRLISRKKLSSQYAIQLDEQGARVSPPEETPATPEPTAYEQRLAQNTASQRFLPARQISGSSSKFIVAYEGSGRNSQAFLEEYTPNGTRLVKRTPISVEYANNLAGGTPSELPIPATPTSVTAAEPMAPTATATGLTAGQRGEAGIFQGLRAPEETAKEETETPPAESLTGTQPDITSPAPPGMPPGGAYVTDPATGQQVYLPPGIDFGALAAATQVPADWEKAAREMFGVWYDVFKNDPEMSAFLQRLMREPEMSDAMFQAELQKTNWWRTTNATARDFARRQVEDPATLNSEIMDRTSVLRQAALDRGLAVDDRSLNDAALKMVQFGFSQQTALNHLAQLTLGTATGPSSLVQGFFGQSVRELAANYGVPLSDATLMKWTGDIATGNQSLNSFEAYARDLAKNLYPSLANGYDRGLSFTQMTSPYAQVASRILDIPDSQIDFTDPKWAAAFTKRDEKGGQVQMTYGEWADYLRTTPSFGYEYTDEAISKAYNVVNDLAELFGRA